MDVLGGMPSAKNVALGAYRRGVLANTREGPVIVPHVDVAVHVDTTPTARLPEAREAVVLAVMPLHCVGIPRRPGRIFFM